ncbi:hypothetical protein MYOV024v1_p0024 [Vibrio phage PS34B.2]|nr:hypothetical protein NVP1007O_29 [Vibrio phage 1.007.O._10N.261.55.F9]QZI90949.1 hypothetical protein MYOV024v1_p0024 [Vibrio phage PS34B.2]
MKNKRVKQMICDVLNYIDNYDSRVYKVESGEIISHLLIHECAGDYSLELEGLAYIGGHISLTADQHRAIK